MEKTIMLTVFITTLVITVYFTYRQVKNSSIPWRMREQSDKLNFSFFVASAVVLQIFMITLVYSL